MFEDQRGAGVNVCDTSVSGIRGQGQGAAPLDAQTACTTDDIGQFVGIGSVEHQRRIVGDGTRAQRTGGAASANLQRACSDGRGTAVVVGACEHQRTAALLGQGAGAADRIGDRPVRGAGAVKDQRGIVGDGTCTQAASGAASAHLDGSPAHGGCAAVGVGAAQGQSAARGIGREHAGAADGAAQNRIDCPETECGSASRCEAVQGVAFGSVCARCGKPFVSRVPSCRCCTAQITNDDDAGTSTAGRTASRHGRSRTATTTTCIGLTRIGGVANTAIASTAQPPQA